MKFEVTDHQVVINLGFVENNNYNTAGMGRGEEGRGEGGCVRSLIMFRELFTN